MNIFEGSSTIQVKEGAGDRVRARNIGAPATLGIE
jgi:hypothetical protein